MEHRLLVISDIHLGCDLVQRTRPCTPPRAAAAKKRDEDLVALLDWYRGDTRSAAPWRLVVAGDFIDFSGMSVAVDAQSDSDTPFTTDEATYGLGSTEKHSVLKLKEVVEAHTEVFDALARFLKAGNSLVFVRGNHDVDLFWPLVQAGIRSALHLSAGLGGPSCAEVAELVHFADWFYYEPGRLFIEHGHHYDQYCAHPFPLIPLALSGEQRCARSLSDTLKRYVVNPTKELTEAGHEEAEMVDYLRHCGRLGVRGCALLIGRFANAVGRLLVDVWSRDPAACVRHEQEQQTKLSELTARYALDAGALERLSGSWQKPGTESVASVLACLMLDRILLTAAVFLSGLWIYFSLGLTAASALAGIGICMAAHTLETRLRAGRGSVDASKALLASAKRVVEELGVELVVMGHTHVPLVADLPEAAQYVNLGSWAEADPGEGWALQASSRTHLVIPSGSVAAAQLFRWENMGPVGYQERPALARPEREVGCPAASASFSVLRGTPAMTLVELEPSQTEAA